MCKVTIALIDISINFVITVSLFVNVHFKKETIYKQLLSLYKEHIKIYKIIVEYY